MESITEYVFELPTNIIYQLCELLDPGHSWEEVARAMPGISAVDIDGCKNSTKPTESLLRIWGSKGYKVMDLFKVFYRIKYVTCMRVLHPYIDPKFHSVSDMCVQRRPILSPKSGHSNDSLARNSDHNTQPSTVYSKKTNSQNEASFLHDTEMSGASSDVFSGLHNTPLVKYEDVRAATNDFADENICGRGGYGVVYRGIWNYTEVAIKRIRTQKDRNGAQHKERIRQSLQELRHLSKLRHDNILSLYAFSMDGSEPCLIYQFMANGSLEDRILCRNGTAPLGWEARKTICQGASRGLHFLHSIGAAPIIHGDVKCANILLDKHMEPKLGDFGLSRDGQVELEASEKSPMIASHIKGTLAYLPPEFTRSKILSTKLDVYSFGVVLLEVATGLRAYSDAREPHSLVSYVNKVMNELKSSSAQTSKLVQSLADKRLQKEDINERIFKQLLSMGLKCSVEDRKLRPSFSEIISSLLEI